MKKATARTKDAASQGRQVSKLQQPSHPPEVPFAQIAQLAIDTIADTVAILDGEGDIVAVNASWREFADKNGLRSPNYGVGLNYLAVCDSARGPYAEEAPLVAEGIRGLLRDKTGEFRCEYPCHCEGERRWFQVRCRYGQNHGHSFLVLAHQNISEVKLSEELLRKQNEGLKLLSKAAEQILSTTDPVRMMQDLFERVSAYLGLDVYFNFGVAESGDALSLHCSAGVPDYVKAHIQLLPFGEGLCGRVALQRRPITINAVQQSEDPAIHVHRRLGIRAVTCHPLLSGERLLGTLGFASRLRDRFEADDIRFIEAICHYVALAWERVYYTRDLEKRVEERTAHLRESVAELEQFSYTLSHDLRAPLRTMRGFAEILLERHAAHLEPQAQDLLQRIAQAATRMDQLIRDVLTFDQISRRPLTLGLVDLNALVTEIVAQYPPFQAAQARISIPSPLLPVRGNTALLTQCISNLLQNAVKFVKPGTVPEVTVRTESADGQVRLWVEDNGIGIDPEYQERIFNTFERVHEEYEGTGIGLAIVRKAVLRMGGQVGVRSEPGQGSQFWIQLPAS